MRDDLPGTGWVPGNHAPVHRPTTQPLRVQQRPPRRAYIPSTDAPGAIPLPRRPREPARAAYRAPSSRSQRVRVHRSVDPAVVCAAVAMAALALTVVVGLIWS